ncbi:DNA cytosine methyltransferase [Paraburkholderia sp. 2C]
MAAYYNEIEPYAAQWLRNLISAGHIAPGDVDERSIEDVRPDDLRGYTQCHFFAGIGTWSYALRLAGWPDDRPVWTGSCPCQPFSAAGKGLGFADERHLWPLWHWLIAQHRPAVVFGEQVASKDVEPWIDLVFTDMEATGYACGADPFPSAGVGAPHIRDRTFFVAYADDARPQGRQRVRERLAERALGSRRVAVALADVHDDGRQPRSERRSPMGYGTAVESDRGSCELGDADGPLERRLCGVEGSAEDSAKAKVCGQDRQWHGSINDRAGATAPEAAGPTNGFWRAVDWLLCRDGKWRPVEPGTFPLVDGAPSRVGRLRAYGNTINPWQAAEFILAAEEARLTA